MDSATFIALSIATSHGIPLALALRELALLRRMRRGGGGPGGGSAPVRPRPSPVPGGTKPLPDCLVPRPLAAPPARARVLEDA